MILSYRLDCSCFCRVLSVRDRKAAHAGGKRKSMCVSQTWQWVSVTSLCTKMSTRRKHFSHRLVCCILTAALCRDSSAAHFKAGHVRSDLVVQTVFPDIIPHSLHLVYSIYSVYLHGKKVVLLQCDITESPGSSSRSSRSSRGFSVPLIIAVLVPHLPQMRVSHTS